MTRPFLNASIDDLEATLERALAGRREAIVEAVADELTYRRIPRAMDLAQRIASRHGTGSKRREESGRPGRTSHGSGHAEARSRVPRSQRQGGYSDLGSGPSRAAHKPTDEQQRAIEAFGTGRSLRINAFAGTGKTSTLEMISRSTRRTGLYLAFNRAIVADARTLFADTVECSTIHALARQAIAHRYRRSRSKLSGRVSAPQLVDILNLETTWPLDDAITLPPRAQAFLIRETIRRFAMSGDDELRAGHVPLHGALMMASPTTLAAVSEPILGHADAIWGRMCDLRDDLPLGHDGYLKLWALSRPRIEAEFILLDEAQDTNPVVLDILRRQTAQLVVVGDRYQQIYEWRGAINAMEQITTDHTASLTRSFRFGPPIAAAATKILALLGEPKPLIGNPAVRSRIGPNNPDAILSRTTASVMTSLVDALGEGRAPHILGGTAELIEMLRGVHDLKAGLPSAFPEFVGFTNWQEVIDFSGTDEGEHLASFVSLVAARGERQLLWALNRTVDEHRADLILSTVHKAKGREWNNVRLTRDFLRFRQADSATGSRTLTVGGQATESTPARGSERGPAECDRAAELRLFYVAITRARRVVDIPQALADRLGIEAEPSVAPTSR